MDMESTHESPFGSRGYNSVVPPGELRHPRCVCYRLKCASPTSVRLKREPLVPSPVPRIWQRFPLPFIFPRKRSLSRYLPRVLRACDSTPNLDSVGSFRLLIFLAVFQKVTKIIIARNLCVKVHKPKGLSSKDLLSLRVRP